jgi:hypothetical protein
MVTAWQEEARQNLTPQADSHPIRLEGTPHTGRKILRYVNPRGAMLDEPMIYDAGNWQQELFIN